MKLETFLTFLQKEELQRILISHRLPPTGSSDKLRELLLQKAPNGLNYTLLKGMSKNRLAALAEKMSIRAHGAKNEIQDRILKILEFPLGSVANAPLVRFTTNGVDVSYFDQEYILSRFFSKEAVQELLRDSDLSAAGSKETLMERYLSNEKPSIRQLLDRANSETLSLICGDLQIEPALFFRRQTIKSILEKIRTMPRRPNPTIDRKNPGNLSHNYQYDVAISFAGEDREKAAELNRLLKARGIKTFYDFDHAATLLGEDLIVKLANIYGEQSRYCAIFVSANYIRKAWPDHERIHAQARQFRDKKAYVLPLLIDDSRVPGLVQTLGNIDLRHHDLKYAADTIVAKLRIN